MDERTPARFIARLLTERYIPRSDALAQRVLIDEGFRQEVERRLDECGLRLLDNPFAEHLAVALSQSAETDVFGGGDIWLSNNLGLQRDGVALLVLLWALIILPKRERQLTRSTADGDEQGDMFGSAKPLPKSSDASKGIAENLLLDDYGKQLGGRTRVNMNLGILSRVGFIRRHNKVIEEGPLLDLAFDYAQLAPRLIQGALGDLLTQRQTGMAAKGDA